MKENIMPKIERDKNGRFVRGHSDLVSPEARKKAGIKISIAQKGKVFSSETKEKMRLAKLYSPEKREELKKRVTRICSICKVEKPRSNFFKDNGNIDGLRTRCKECDKIITHESYLKNKKAILQKSQEYRKTEKGKLVRKREHARKRKLFPEKYRANYLASNAIRGGHLIKQPCEICGNEKVQAHHDDYSEPLKVRWLCKDCHNEFHQSL